MIAHDSAGPRIYEELVETTDWSAYRRGRAPRCANCMAHCGYEPAAVLATMGSLRQSLRAVGNVGRQDQGGRDGVHLRMRQHLRL
jgi:hypothetical protein